MSYLTINKIYGNVPQKVMPSFVMNVEDGINNIYLQQNKSGEICNIPTSTCYSIPDERKIKEPYPSCETVENKSFLVSQQIQQQSQICPQDNYYANLPKRTVFFSNEKYPFDKVYEHQPKNHENQHKTPEHKTHENKTHEHKTHENKTHEHKTHEHKTHENSERETKNCGIPNINMTWEKIQDSKSLYDPYVWGPAFWLSIHTGALKYPKKASPICKEKMKGFIMGLPYILPCESCSDHAKSFIEENYENLDEIVSGSQNLFKFFNDFHNFVNMRYGKNTLTLEEAYNIYKSGVKLQYRS